MKRNGLEELLMGSFPGDGCHRGIFSVPVATEVEKMKDRCGMISDFPYNVLLSVGFCCETPF